MVVVNSERSCSFGRGRFRWGDGLGDWQPPILEVKNNKTKIEITCEYYSTNEGKHSGHLHDYNFFFVELLPFLV